MAMKYYSYLKYFFLVLLLLPIQICFSDTKEYSEILDPLVDEGLLPGYYFAVYRGDRVLFERSRGFADVAERIEPDGDTIYAMMSMTKPLMGLLVLTLVEDGSLKLADPVSKYLTISAPPSLVL